MAKILLVEDDRELAKSLVSWLEHEHNTVEHCERGFDALERLKFFEFDVIILDWNLPEMSGIEILREFRDRGGTAPVLILTGRDSVSEIETGLYSGADDYMVKPCDVRVLSARVRAVMRRKTKVYDQVFQIRGLEIDLVNHRISRDGVEIELQRQQLALLEFLLRNPNSVFTQEDLLLRVWTSGSEAVPDTVRSCVNRIRNKLDLPDQPSIIRTIPKVGYQINLPENETDNDPASE
jgi:OmpR-family two-component system manganese-sensing response regulator